MFGLLKNKLTSFINSLAGKEKNKEESASAQPPAAPAVEKEEAKPEPIKEAPKPVQEEKKIEVKKGEAAKEIHKPHIAEKKIEEKKQEPIKEPPKPHIAEKKTDGKKIEEKKHEQIKETPKSFISEKKAEPAIATPKPSVPEKKQEPITETPKPAQQEKKIEEKRSVEKPIPALPSSVVVEKKPEEKKQSLFPFFQKPEPKKADSKPMAAPPATVEKKPEPRLQEIEKKAMSEKRDMAPKIGLGTTIRSFFSNEITIGEAEVSDLLSELELSLLEADVAYDVSLQVTEQLKTKLIGMKVPKGEVAPRTRQAISDVLESIMDNDSKFELAPRVRSLEKPAKILFVGPNGAGKTTTMAKVARMLMDNGMTVVFSASDTFRAAAIEQAEVHATRLGITIIKSNYGADPASVAFDAINYARSHNIDAVLIDSAGRQDTNANLLDELKKMNRVAKPDIKIYIGESIGGNSIIEQIRAFNEAIGLDGAILTKIDCDAKGGTAISVSRSTGIPVLYLGIGQGYADLVPFDPHKIAQEIMT